MLNKGPFVDEAVRVLADILRRMEKHHYKKRSLFRELRVSTFMERPGGDTNGDPAHSGSDPIRPPRGGARRLRAHGGGDRTASRTRGEHRQRA